MTLAVQSPWATCEPLTPVHAFWVPTTCFPSYGPTGRSPDRCAMGEMEGGGVWGSEHFGGSGLRALASGGVGSEGADPCSLTRGSSRRRTTCHRWAGPAPVRTCVHGASQYGVSREASTSAGVVGLWGREGLGSGWRHTGSPRTPKKQGTEAQGTRV